MLNHDYFIVLAGDPKHLDEEVLRRVTAGETLSDVQLSQYELGRRGAKLFKSHYAGWIVVAISHLQEPQIIISSDVTEGRKEWAIAWGCMWAKRDPKNREFIARKSDIAELEHAPEFAEK